MSRTPRLPLLVRRGRIWAAKVRVPADVRAVLGRSVFVQSTGEEDAAKAWVKAQPWVKAWKAQIEAARNGNAQTVQQKIATARAIFRKAERTGMDAWEAVEDLLRDLGIDPDPEEPATEKERKILDQIDGTRTPFSAQIEAWEAQLGLGERERRMYVSDVKAWAETHPTESVEDLEGRTVQAWIDRLAREGLTRKTIERKLSALRNYWGYLQAHEIVSEDRKPFHSRKLPKDKRPRDEVRAAFTPDEIVRLYRAALDRRDRPLADLIWVAAHTGGRIEELCSIQAKHVNGVSITIPGTKTEAAPRIVPIHSAVAETVQRLMRDSRDSYLVPSAADNQYGERSAPLGKRFGRLKTKLGFGPAHVFHCIRNTVATLLEDAGCPENVAADIVGHDKPTITYGLYSGGSSLETKREWLERAIRYPAVT